MRLCVSFVVLLLIEARQPAWYELSADYSFADYCGAFGKKYGNEYDKRAAIFKAELVKIIAHNSDQSSTYKMGVNQFTDVEAHELNFGFNKALSRDYNSVARHLPAPGEIDLSQLPKSVDWRTHVPSVVTAVKDQGNCGSCWAFASTETLESHVALATKQLMVLSPQQLVSCSKNPDHCGGTGGCQGSIPELAFDYVKQNGMATEWTYPYESGTDSSTGTCKKNGTYTPVITVEGFSKLAPNNYAAVMQALATIGPLAVNVQANVWRNYETGVFTGCSNMTGVDIDHVVSLVGYGTDEEGGDYWLVRNSWNTVWGEAGYIRLKRSATPACGTDPTPEDGTGCKGAATQHVCGECGVLFDVSYPKGAKLL